MKKTELFLFITGFSLCILQLWLPQYYLTGDGPCHVYNAWMLHDFWNNKDVFFYEKFFFQNKSIEPNYATHIIMALLMFFVSGALAEKILLTGYLMLFTTGFYFLTRQLNKNSGIWPVVFFIFIFNHCLTKGFYNFTYSIAFLFWWLWSWINYLNKRNIPAYLIFILLTAVVFFTHVMVFVYGCITCSALLISFYLAENKVGHKRHAFVKMVVALLAAFIPFVFMLWLYTTRHSGINTIKIEWNVQRFYDLFNNAYSLVNLTHNEAYVAIVIACLVIIMFIVVVVSRFIKKRKINKYDGMLVSLAFTLFIYLFFPDWLLGGGLLVVRAQLFVYIFLCLCIAYIPVLPVFTNIIGIVLFIGFLSLSILRIPCILSASRGLEDYISCGKYIHPYKVVLPLAFSKNGKDEDGNFIANANWVFCHASQYLGVEKPLIILDNYEAEMGIFPFLWQPDVNPYYHLSAEEGIEGDPPYADIERYYKESNVVVDYVITWCYDSSFISKGHVAMLMNELNQHYHIAYRSSTNRTVLYERN